MNKKVYFICEIVNLGHLTFLPSMPRFQGILDSFSIISEKLRSRLYKSGTKNYCFLILIQIFILLTMSKTNNVGSTSCVPLYTTSVAKLIR